MPRYNNPADINFSQGEPTPNGKLSFFESGTSTPKSTFADVGESVPNAQPVLLDSAGREPNIFYSGSAKVVLQDENGNQVWERDPVGGESVLGNFSDFNLSIIYGLNDTVQTSNGDFYKSLANANQGNIPLLSPDKWELLNILGVWNENITYSIGDIVSSTLGNLWKALTATSANNPETDDGTNWVEAFNKQWINKSAGFSVKAGKMYQIDASAGSVDGALATTYNIGDSIIVHNESISTNLVRLTNTALTIKGAGGTVTSSDNLVLAAGDTVHMVAKTTTILEVV